METLCSGFLRSVTIKHVKLAEYGDPIDSLSFERRLDSFVFHFLDFTMPFFFGSNRRSGSKPKGQEQSSSTKNAREFRGSVEGRGLHKEELITQVNHLQSEMSRLQMQLASMQTQGEVEKFKEESSTQRSHQTFSTKGTTPPATASGIRR